MERILDVSDPVRNALCDYEECLDELYAYLMPPGCDWSRVHSIAGKPRIGRALYRELVTRLFQIALDAESTPFFLDMGFDLDTDLDDWDATFSGCYITYKTDEDGLQSGLIDG